MGTARRRAFAASPGLPARTTGPEPRPAMTLRIVRTLALALACAAVPSAARAQLLSAEVRGGIVLPRDAFSGDVDADGGYSTEISLTFGVLPFVGVYGAWQRAEFDREGTESSVITDEGWGAGVRVNVPTPLIPIDPWIRAGVVVHELEAGGLNGGGDRGVGTELAGGLRFGVGRGLALTPGVTWTRYGFDDDSLPDGEVSVEYLRVDVGLRVGF
jgi:hypothetical protein